MSGIKRKIGSYTKQVVEVQVEETLNSRTRIMLATYHDQFDSYYKVLFFFLTATDQLKSSKFFEV